MSCFARFSGRPISTGQKTGLDPGSIRASSTRRVLPRELQNCIQRSAMAPRTWYSGPEHRFRHQALQEIIPLMEADEKNLKERRPLSSIASSKGRRSGRRELTARTVLPCWRTRPRTRKSCRHDLSAESPQSSPRVPGGLRTGIGCKSARTTTPGWQPRCSRCRRESSCAVPKSAHIQSRRDTIKTPAVSDVRHHLHVILSTARSGCLLEGFELFSPDLSPPRDSPDISCNDDRAEAIQHPNEHE